MTFYRFGAFEFDTEAGELRQHGDLVKLQPQPSKVLEVLVRRGGEIVTRREVREQQAETQHRDASAAFARLHGEQLLGCG